MGLDGFLWHVTNFFAPAVWVGFLSAAWVKLIYRHRLQGVAFMRLLGWAVCSATLALSGSLFFWGRDGKMAAYGAMVVGCALTLTVLGRPRRP